MEFIIFDLEWNNAYNYKTKTGMNEIIEIGAVKLNERLEITDTFKQLIKPQVSKKLGSRFKNLTNITMEEINASGVDFDKAFADFARWSGGKENIFLSWSNSDLYTLVFNYQRFKNTSYIDFLGYYADAQKYCMSFLEDCNSGNQISLSKCAERFDININDLALHRALEDCYVTAFCFKKVYDKEKFLTFVSKCDKAFFERLVFKPYCITNLNDDIFDVNSVTLECPVCGGEVVVLNEYEFSNNAFRNAGKCKKCKKKLWVYVRAKKTYDDIVVSKRLVVINRKRAKYIN